jgi:hypothetical protein
VREGEALTVDAAVTNVGNTTATKPIRLVIAGSTRDERNVTLAPGDTGTVRLVWGTAEGDAGLYAAAVTSPDDADDATVRVTAVDDGRDERDGDDDGDPGGGAGGNGDGDGGGDDGGGVDGLDGGDSGGGGGPDDDAGGGDSLESGDNGSRRNGTPSDPGPLENASSTRQPTDGTDSGTVVRAPEETDGSTNDTTRREPDDDRAVIAWFWPLLLILLLALILASRYLVEHDEE